jgi:hypothetical protein
MSDDVTPPVTAEVPPVAETKEVPTGSKTPEPNLYAALEEERRDRKEAERRAREAEEALAQRATPAEDIYSDEGKMLKNQIGALNSKLEDLQKERDLEKLYAEFPVLKEKSGEFDEFAKDYPRHKLDNVAKIFLVERGLLEEVTTRKGLEKPTAGPKEAPSGTSSEDVATLRRTNYKKYLELLQTGKLNPSDIK